MLIGTAVCGKPHVRWCERVDGVKRPSLYFKRWLKYVLLFLYNTDMASERYPDWVKKCRHKGCIVKRKGAGDIA